MQHFSKLKTENKLKNLNNREKFIPKIILILIQNKIDIYYLINF